MRNSLFACVLILGILQVHSQSVSFEEAEQVAQHFFGKIHKSMQTCASVSVEGQDTLLYVFNADNGFVVISGNKKVIPVLAYSNESTYDKENVIPPVKMWLNSYQRQLAELRKNVTLQQSMLVSNSWKELQEPVRQHKTMTSSFAPLLTSKWGQGTFYNFYCPKDEEGTNGRAVTGCVATAMAQIMYYFRYPHIGIDTHSYEHDLYGTLFADFSQATYDYNTMPDKPKAINLPASLLTFHCGVAANMKYGAKASSAWSQAAANALKNNFGYSQQTELVHKWEVSNWDSLLVEHLDGRIPLYYAGTDTARKVAHAFVCDAYQKDSIGNYYYHFNFGWDGYEDGYFYVNPLLGESMAYHVSQEIIINAFPDTANYDYPIQPPLTGTDTLTAEAGSFTDGTIYDCPPNMDYIWLIRPDVDKIQKITFDIQYKLAEGDTIFVTSPNNTINTFFTHDTSTFSKDVADSKITVRLKTTNELIPSGGFSANYITVYTIHCGGIVQSYSAKQGTFDDGSGKSRYNNNAYCRYRIAVNGIDSIMIRFNIFETEKDKDVLYIHNNAVGSNPLLMTLSGTYTDSVYTFYTNKLFFIFETDEENFNQGWELSYYTDIPAGSGGDDVGIDELDKGNYFSIYPNPATNCLYVSAVNLLEKGQIRLYDIYGRLLIKQAIEKDISQVDMNNLAAGMYIVKITDGDKVCKIKRIIKE